jgi:hypothetical protein
MTGRLSRRAQARQAAKIEAQIACAVRDLESADEHVRAEAVRQLCPCRTHMRWTLDRYVLPMLHDASPEVRFAANFVLTEELEHEMVRDARAAHTTGLLRHFACHPPKRAGPVSGARDLRHVRRRQQLGPWLTHSVPATATSRTATRRRWRVSGDRK